MKSLKLILVGAVALLSTSVLAQTPAQFALPTKAVARAIIADLNSDEPVESQWASGNRQVKYAWDFSKNCYSEQYVGGVPLLATVATPAGGNGGKQGDDRGDGPKDDKAGFMQSTCGGSTVTFKNKKCTTVANATTVQTPLTNYYTNVFNTFEGIVSDPFRSGDKAHPNPLRLWKNANNKSWLWLDSVTNDIVYLQDYRADIKRSVALFFPEGTSEDQVSSYNFQIFKCQ